MRKGGPKFENLLIISLAASALGGTSFSGADLTEASFASASLKSTNFANSRKCTTTLARVCWKDVKKLNRARLGTSNLQDPRVRFLLTTLDGKDLDFSHANLQDAHLAEVQLQRAILKGTNFNRATLRAAQLNDAILSEAQCIGTNFTAAHLSGACLEAWNIDETTTLTDVDCDFVFLKERQDRFGNRERLPHNPDKLFQPGDFEKYFREVMDEVKLLIRGGVDPQAFKSAFQALMQTHDIKPTDVRGIERKDTDVLIRIAVPSTQPKAEVARTFETTYDRALPESTAQALLEAERQNKQEIIQLANKSIDSISSVLSNFTITNMNNPINTGDGSVYAGRDANLTGNTFNLGEISGQVTNQIGQLPDTEPTEDKPNLKDLLSQLKAAILDDSELGDDEKAEALGEITKLVKAGSNPKEGAMQRMAKRATDTLKAIAEPLSSASKLATACKTVLPMLISLF
ncbi:MAG: pentapeptide repeat-containing protein [Cyanobacteria bacterium J06642_2]